MPSLPFPPPAARSRASTPPSPSPARDMGALETEMGFLSVENTTTRSGKYFYSPSHDFQGLR